tara:strand:- start:692 stop:925 length:234 start_codon:yes stop_codon:yes gene_type:complete
LGFSIFTKGGSSTHLLTEERNDGADVAAIRGRCSKLIDISKEKCRMREKAETHEPADTQNGCADTEVLSAFELLKLS